MLHSPVLHGDNFTFLPPLRRMVQIASISPLLLTVDACSDCKFVDTWGDSHLLPQLWNELVQTSLLMPFPPGTMDHMHY